MTAGRRKRYYTAAGCHRRCTSWRALCTSGLCSADRSTQRPRKRNRCNTESKLPERLCKQSRHRRDGRTRFFPNWHRLRPHIPQHEQKRPPCNRLIKTDSAGWALPVTCTSVVDAAALTAWCDPLPASSSLGSAAVMAPAGCSLNSDLMAFAFTLLRLGAWASGGRDRRHNRQARAARPPTTHQTPPGARDR